MARCGRVMLGWVVLPVCLAFGGVARADAPDAGSPEAPDAGASLRFSGRGVSYFDSSIPCPLAGFATRGAHACNRVALDDAHTTVSVDLQRHEIVVANSTPYPKKAVIVDLTFLGTVSTKKGETVPVGIHCKLSKDGTKVKPNVHIHPTTRDEMVEPQIDRFTVIYDDGKARKVMMKPDDPIQAMRHPGVMSRIEGALVSVRDNLATDKDDPAKPGYHLADVSVGIGGAGLAHDIIRAELILNQPLPAEHGTIAGVLQSTEGQFKLTSLSRLLPKDALNRDLFLLGLDGLPAVQGVLKSGLAKGESLVVAVKPNHAEIQVGTQTSEVSNASEVIRDYLEFSFLGAILDKQAEQRLASAAAPPVSNSGPASK